MTIIIAGAGIAGLTAALSLHQVGVDVLVVERSERLRPLGVGINLLPHAVRELFEAGLEEELAETGVATAALAYFSKRGQQIWREPRGRAAGYRWPQYSIHRGRLQMLLFEAVRRRLGSDRILLGHAVEGFRSDGAGIEVLVQRRSDGNRQSLHGSMLIGADGIHSAIRTRLYPNEGPPKWNGVTLWRGVTPNATFLDNRTMIMAGYALQKFVAYPILPEAGGATAINWVAERRGSPDQVWRREDWNRVGELADFLPAFESWSFGWIDVAGLVRAAPVCYEYPMVDRDPLPQWSFGRVTLIGDAAHPMYPVGSNGASQAILDARVLAREVRDRGVTEEALAAYEADRRPATAAVVHANRKNGPEDVMTMVEQRAPAGFSTVGEVLSAEELQGIAEAYKRVAGFSIDELNARPAIL